MHEAGVALRAFEELELEFCEQPIDMHNIVGLSDLRQRTRTPIAANQTAWLNYDVLEIIRQAAADVIVTDQHQLGGLSLFLDVAAMCDLAGLPVVKHSFGDLGPTTAASLHALAALSSPALGHQTFLSLLESDLLVDSFDFEDGSLPLPTEPGIGVELDRDAVEHYEDLYRSFGEAPAYADLDVPSPFGAS
jgi:L-alanine-DL-glutamate epimerase-like enolase superfamily enzyme